MQEEGDEDQLPLQEEEGCVQVNGKDELVACDDICKETSKHVKEKNLNCCEINEKLRFLREEWKEVGRGGDRKGGQSAWRRTLLSM